MEQARHAASTKRHARHELQNRRKRKPVFLRMMGVLLVAGAALACFGLWRFQTPGIVLGPFEDEPSTAESVPPPEPEPQPVTTTLRFSATGDNLIHAPIYKQAARRAAEGQRYNFDYCYEHLLDFYAAQDVNWINQETLCSKELEPSTYPCFSTPGECAEALYRAGIRVFSLSNNHTYDKGAKGIAATLRFWDEMPEDVVTTGLWYGESDYGTIPLQTVNGVTIAYLSYTDHTNGIPQSNAMTANVIYTSQRDLAQQLSDWGADVILGTHPHVVQDAEWKTSVDGRQTFVAYSLGNFISTQSKPDQLIGAILTLELNKTTDPDGSVHCAVASPQLHPTVTHYDAGKSNVRTYLFRDYTSELAQAHGVRAAYPSFGIEYIQNVLQTNINSAFLAFA